MKITNLAGHKTVNSYVKSKLDKLNSTECSLKSLYEIMFSEKENIMFEKSVGYRIKKVTYGECFEEAEKRAAAISALAGGIEKGAVIGLYMENSAEWIESFWAILRAGYNVLFMNLRLDTETLEGVLSETGAKAVISDSISFSLPTFFEKDIKSENGGALSDDFGQEILMITSGTSSNVKICSYSAQELYLIIKNSASIVSSSRLIKKHYRGELKLLTFLPFYHVFGFVAVYLWFAFFSRTFVLLNDMSPDTVVNTIKRHNVTHIFAVPLFWNKVYESAMATVRSRGEETVAKLKKGLAISKKLEAIGPLYRLFGKAAYKEIRENMFGDSIIFMITGGSEIKSEVIEFFNSVGYHLANGYGMTEIGITSVELSTSPKTLNSRSVGFPLDSVEYAVGSDGELLVRGNSSARFISEKGVKREREEWFHTRDLAEYKNGGYYILGRMDDLIIDQSGENLNPNIMEELIGKIKNVKDICLVGVNSPDGKKPLLILGVEKYLDAEAISRIKSEVLTRLEEIKSTGRISEIFLTEDDLIDGSEIKLNRRLIAERYQNGKLKEVGLKHENGAITDDNLSRRVAEIFSQVLGKPADAMSGDFDFFIDGGGTSLDYFTVTSVLREEFSISPPPASEQTLSRISAISEFIKTSRKN